MKFFEVGNVSPLEKELDQIYVGNMKLFVNILKYRRAEADQPVRYSQAIMEPLEHSYRGLKNLIAFDRREKKSKEVWRVKKGKERKE